jgi:gas vesicle protein
VAGDRKEKTVEQNPIGATGQTGSRGQGSQVTEQAKQQGQQLAQQARQQAGELANRGGEQVKSQLETQKHQVAQRMTPMQMALRETAQQLRKQGQGPVAQYADKASDQVERFSGYLRETEVDEMVDEVRGFARSRPALFLGSAALLGFLGTRFLKSSSQRGTSAGQGSGANGTAISSATVTHGTGEPATALPTGTVAGSPTARRTPMSGQPLSEGDRPQTPRVL